MDLVTSIAKGFVERFGPNCSKRLPEIAIQIGLSLEEIDADSFDGALLRVAGAPIGTIVLNSNIREPGRRLFTIAHEIGHYVLPNQQNHTGTCTKESVSNWGSYLADFELEANRFAAEILMPEEELTSVLNREPSVDSVEELSLKFGTTLTAAGYRLVELTSYRIAMVWSVKSRAKWYKASAEFDRAIKLGSLDQGTIASDLFAGQYPSNGPQSVRADAWLFSTNLRENARILEHSILLPNYEAVFTLLYIQERIELRTEFDEEQTEDLDPIEFTLQRNRWPTKR
jgi:hypothetical protein